MRSKLYPLLNPRDLSFYDDQMSAIIDSFFNVFDDVWSDKNRLRTLVSNDSKYPKTNISHTDKSINIEMSVPGLTAEDIDIECTSDGILSINSSRQESQTTENEKSIISEIKKSRFSRGFNLKALGLKIDNNKEIDTILKNGILSIKVPLQDQKSINNQSFRKIDIKSE